MKEENEVKIKIGKKLFGIFSIKKTITPIFIISLLFSMYFLYLTIQYIEYSDGFRNINHDSSSDGDFLIFTDKLQIENLSEDYLGQMEYENKLRYFTFSKYYSSQINFSSLTENSSLQNILLVVFKKDSSTSPILNGLFEDSLIFLNQTINQNQNSTFYFQSTLPVPPAVDKIDFEIKDIFTTSRSHLNIQIENESNIQDFTILNQTKFLSIIYNETWFDIYLNINNISVVFAELNNTDYDLFRNSINTIYFEFQIYYKFSESYFDYTNIEEIKDFFINFPSYLKQNNYFEVISTSLIDEFNDFNYHLKIFFFMTIIMTCSLLIFYYMMYNSCFDRYYHQILEKLLLIHQLGAESLSRKIVSKKLFLFFLFKMLLEILIYIILFLVYLVISSHSVNIFYFFINLILFFFLIIFTIDFFIGYYKNIDFFRPTSSSTKKENKIFYETIKKLQNIFQRIRKSKKIIDKIIVVFSICLLYTVLSIISINLKNEISPIQTFSLFLSNFLVLFLILNVFISLIKNKYIKLFLKRSFKSIKLQDIFYKIISNFKNKRLNHFLLPILLIILFTESFYMDKMFYTKNREDYIDLDVKITFNSNTNFEDLEEYLSSNKIQYYYNYTTCLASSEFGNNLYQVCLIDYNKYLNISRHNIVLNNNFREKNINNNSIFIRSGSSFNLDDDDNLNLKFSGGITLDISKNDLKEIKQMSGIIANKKIESSSIDLIIDWSLLNDYDIISENYSYILKFTSLDDNFTSEFEELFNSFKPNILKVENPQSFSESFMYRDYNIFQNMYGLILLIFSYLFAILYNFLLNREIFNPNNAIDIEKLEILCVNALIVKKINRKILKIEIILTLTLFQIIGLIFLLLFECLIY